MSPKLASVRVTVHRGLVKNADVVGKSDPYVVLKLDGQTKKTTVIKDNLEPIWNETLEMTVLTPTPILYIDVFDEDTVGEDDPLGSGLLDLGELARDPAAAVRNVRVPLQLKGKREGWVELSVVGTERAAHASATAQAAAAHFQSIVLTVQSGRKFTKGDIGSKPDPFVVVKTLPNGHSDVFQTSVQDNTSEPSWQESHEFNVVGETDFKIQVYDKDLAGQDLLGEIRVPFSELSLHEGPLQRWIPVFKKREAAGELMLHFVASADASPTDAVSDCPTLPPSPAAETGGLGPLGALKVTVIDGRGLTAKDLVGSIDPYVEVLAGADSYKTKVASGTDPIWGDSHTFDIVLNPTHEVEFRVSDKDRLSRDDFIGRAALPIGSITKAETHTLVLHNQSGSATGSIRIALEPFFSLAAHAPSPPAAAAPAAVVALPPPPVADSQPSEERGFAYPADTQPLEDPTVPRETPETSPEATPVVASDEPAAPQGELLALTVLVKAAKDLPVKAGGKAEPYVRVITRRETLNASGTKSTRSRKQGEAHTFDMRGVPSLKFEVYNKDTATRNDFLCEATVDPAQLPLEKGPITHRVSLYRKNGEPAGRLLVAFGPTFGAPAAPSARAAQQAEGGNSDTPVGPAPPPADPAEARTAPSDAPTETETDADDDPLPPPSSPAPGPAVPRLEEPEEPVDGLREPPAAEDSAPQPPATPDSPHPPTPPRPVSPPLDPEAAREAHIAELRRQIEEQRQRNHDLQRHGDHETRRLRDELADQRAELSQSLRHLRMETDRQRQRQRRQRPASSPHSVLPPSASLPAPGYGPGYGVGSLGPRASLPPVTASLPARVGYSPPQTGPASPAAWAPAVPAAHSLPLPYPSAAPIHRVVLPPRPLAIHNSPIYASSGYAY